MRAILIDWLVEVHLKFKVRRTYCTLVQQCGCLCHHLASITDQGIQPALCDLQLMPETLFLTVNLIDRFLNEKQVTRKNLQLVGAAAFINTHYRSRMFGQPHGCY